MSNDKPVLTQVMADKYDMNREHFISTVKATCIKAQCTDEQFASFLMVANEYDLNPFTKEIYAFPSNGGIQPIVSIDGWMKIINSHQQFNGMQFKDTLDESGKITAITCMMYRKDREHPIEVTEYLSECAKNSPTWKQWPARMLRHKSAIQAARYAFGFSGIVDPDEAERMQQPERDITPVNQDNLLDISDDSEMFDVVLSKLESGAIDREFISDGYILSPEQTQRLASA